MPNNANKWGIDEAYCNGIGNIMIAFQYLEQHIVYTIHVFLGGDIQIAECVTAEMAFAKRLDLLSSLYKFRVKQIGQREPKLECLLKDALGKADKAASKRNHIVHSQWGYDAKRKLDIAKIEARRKHGLRAVRLPVKSPADLLAIVEQIEDADTALLGFCSHFVGVYHNAY
jgi:hypothetical protein